MARDMQEPPLETIASVVLDEGIDLELDYAIPSSLAESVAIGQRVRVPLRSSFRMGTIMAIEKKSSSFSLKPLDAILSLEPYIVHPLVELGEWMAEYYCCPLRKILRLFLPPPIRRDMAAKKTTWVLPAVSKEELESALAHLQKKSPAKARLIRPLLNEEGGISLSTLLLQTKSSRSSYLALLEQKLIRAETRERERDPLENAEYLHSPAKPLSLQQQAALEKIVATLKKGEFATHLLHGITGSGKTEVYLQAIDFALTEQKTALFLVPEIALTSQTVERIRSRFRDKVALLHHRLSDGERRDAWHALHRGEIRIALGARSSIFAPLQNLGLIIIDEEHEGAYKQTDEAPCYHGRDVSIMRGKLCNATVVLGSATPSMETYQNALEKKYILSLMDTRPANARLPEIHIIDMRKEANRQGSSLFSAPLLKALEERLKRGEQSLLFLNRRGYHAFRLCTACGKTIECIHCDLALTFHKKENRLICHLCGYQLTPPSACPHCHTSDHQKYHGFGTEQVERSLHAIFPEARVLRLDADTTRRKGSHDRGFKEFRSGKADILVGTQMVAKGLDFPNVTLVGSLSADSTLHIPDFRAAERVFQLVTQVAGRAGRSTLPGEVFIQTWLPEHPAIALAAAQRYNDFYLSEIEARELFGYPPFSRFVKIVASHESAPAAEDALRALSAQMIAKLPQAFAILPITACGYAKMKGVFRFQLMIKGPSCLPVSRLFKLFNQKSSSRVRFLIDCDPISTFF